MASSGTAVPDPPVRPHRWVAAVVLVSYLLAALVVTWRLWADPASHTVAGNPDDADLFAWYLRYAATAVAHGRLPALVTTTLNSPHGINVMWNSSVLLPGVLLAPVTLLLGTQVSLTIATTAGFAGSAAAMFWVLRRWGVSAVAAALAGAVYGFSPALLHSAIGHYNLQLAILPPLIIDAGLCLAVGRPGSADSRPASAQLRAGARLGLLVAAQLFISEELALTTALTGLLLVAVLAAGSPRAAARRLGPAAAGLAVAGAVTLLLAGWALWTQFFGPLTQRGTPFLRDFYVNDVTGFVQPSGLLLFHTSASAAAAARYQGQAPEYLAYLGWPLLVVLALCAVAFWRHRVVRAMAITLAVLGVLSLGGHPLVGGTTHPAVTLPWHWVESIPLGGSVLPDRLSTLADGLAAVLLALSIDLGRARFASAARGPALITALAVLACLPLLPLPLPDASAPPLPAGWLSALAQLRLPPGARILVVPVPEVHLTPAMRWQADTTQPYSLIGGYYIGPAWNGLAYVDGNGLTATAVYLDQLWAAGLRPGSPAAISATAAGLARPGARLAPSQVRADLAAWRPAAVVAVAAPDSPLGRYLVQLLGRPVVESGSILAWRPH
jgi:hypothetical protein